MKSLPRILPLVGVAAGGVLAINALSGARDLPSLVTGARAFAEDMVKAKPAAGKKSDKPAAAAKDAKATADAAAIGQTVDAAAALPPPTIQPKAVCAPTAAELAKQAGLSPAELQVLQSLGERRGQLDQRESDLSTQLALMSAAEAKLDAKIQALNGLKAEVTGLLTQADTKEAAEIDRLVKVFEGMKAKDAAPRMVALDDSVRIPIAAKMKERSLSAIVASMPPAEAKKLTESLAHRFSDAQAAAARATQVADAAAAKVGPPAGQAPAATPPAKSTPAKAPRKTAAAGSRKKAPASQQAQAKPQDAAAPPAAAAAAPKAAGTPAAPAAAAPGKTG